MKSIVVLFAALCGAFACFAETFSFNNAAPGALLQVGRQAGTTITVDRHLAGEGIEPVQTCCVHALSMGKPVRLRLRDVAAIDDRARAMLRYLAAEGVDLAANGHTATTS